MADDPLKIHEQTIETHHDSDASCPFCTITSIFQPISPADTKHSNWDPDRLSPPTYILLSTEHVVAFLDIAPLTRGHGFLTRRRHRVKIGNCSSDEAAELEVTFSLRFNTGLYVEGKSCRDSTRKWYTSGHLYLLYQMSSTYNLTLCVIYIGRVLPLVARSVLPAILPDIPHDEADYNVVQNNGPGAAQVMPHVHFHIIPRPPLDYKAPTPSSSESRTSASSKQSSYARPAIPTGLKASFVQFGRGQRNELDDDDAAVLVKQIRENVKIEWEREFGSVDGSDRALSGGRSRTAVDDDAGPSIRMTAKL